MPQTQDRIDGAQLGAFLRARRLAAGRTLGQVAAATGISPSRLATLELGAAAFLPTPARLSALAAALGTDRRELLDLAGYGDE